MQGTPRVPLVRRTGFGVIDRQANFIPGAFDASSFLFPIGQRRLLDKMWSKCISTLEFSILPLGCYVIELDTKGDPRS